MIYKYIKCESVIAKIMADCNMSENKIRITDIREWIFEAIDKIGAPMQYIEKESGTHDCPIFKIEDCLTPLPDDLVHLTAVAFSPTENGEYVPVRTDNSEFKNPKIGHGHEEPPIDNLITSKSQLYGFNLSRFSKHTIHEIEDVKFFIKPGWIVFNRKKGFVKLQYKAIATDDRGYPLIPDLTSYQEAIYWYVMMKLTFPKWLNGNFSTKRAASGAQYAYIYIQQQWNFYRNQAYAEAMMPTESDMRSIKNEWNKLVPEWDADEVFFKTEGKKQLNYTDYYYGY